MSAHRFNYLDASVEAEDHADGRFQFRIGLAGGESFEGELRGIGWMEDDYLFLVRRVIDGMLELQSLYERLDQELL